MAKSKKRPLKGSDPNNAIVASNRRARHDFEIRETIECGMVLKGSEVKSLREAGVRIAESYARVHRGELFVHSLHISHYSHAGAAFQHEPERRRKLLASRSEIDRLSHEVDTAGLTLVPLQVYFKNGRAKLELGLGRRKKAHDKRADIAKRDADLEARKAMAAGMRRRNS